MSDSPLTGDGTDKLCMATYKRKAEPRDYIGGADAQMLHDAAAVIEALERRLAECREELATERELVSNLVAQGKALAERAVKAEMKLAARDAAIGEARRRAAEDVACGCWCGIMDALKDVCAPRNTDGIYGGTPTPSPRMMKGCGNTETCLHPCDHGEDHKECGDCQNSDQSNNCPKCEPVKEANP